MFPSKYLSASDLEQPTDVKIESVEMETLQVPGKSPEDKPTITFAGDIKSLILNVTNKNTIEALYGDDTDGWVGKWITVHADKCQFNAKLVPCIRVKPEAPRPFVPPEDESQIPF